MQHRYSRDEGLLVGWVEAAEISLPSCSRWRHNILERAVRSTFTIISNMSKQTRSVVISFFPGYEIRTGKEVVSQPLQYPLCPAQPNPAQPSPAQAKEGIPVTPPHVFMHDDVLIPIHPPSLPPSSPLPSPHFTTVSIHTTQSEPHPHRLMSYPPYAQLTSEAQDVVWFAEPRT
jgi:hypothetical protein